MTVVDAEFVDLVSSVSVKLAKEATVNH